MKSDGAGFVTRFDVDAAHLSQFPIEQAGGPEHSEYWIPTERLDEFTEHIAGFVAVIAEFRA